MKQEQTSQVEWSKAVCPDCEEMILELKPHVCRSPSLVSVHMRRQQAIETAVAAADRIILDASDGSREETNYLTAMVAQKFIEKALLPLIHAMLTKDLGLLK